MVEISSGESVTNTILATPGHFIFASDANSTFSDAVAVPAEDLTEATVLWSLVDNRLLPCKVHSAIETVEENGIYTLFTQNGRMVVDGGLVVSNYAAKNDGIWFDYDHGRAPQGHVLAPSHLQLGMCVQCVVSCHE